MNNNLIAVIAIVVLVILGAGIYQNQRSNKLETENIINSNNINMDNDVAKKDDVQQKSDNEPTNKKTVAVFETSLGNFEIELFTDKMPITTANFIKLAQSGFYNGTLFHRVIANFMIQGGDPLTKGPNEASYGTGGPGYTIADEFVPGLSNVRGTIAMANTGQPNSGGSQFFINVVDNSFLDFNKEPLTSKHPVFGQVVSGMEVIDKIIATPTAEGDRPIKPVMIKTIKLR